MPFKLRHRLEPHPTCAGLHTDLRIATNIQTLCMNASGSYLAFGQLYIQSHRKSTHVSVLETHILRGSDSWAEAWEKRVNM